MAFWYRFDVGDAMSGRYSSRYGSDINTMEFGCRNEVDKKLIFISTTPMLICQFDIISISPFRCCVRYNDQCRFKIDLMQFCYLGDGIPLPERRGPLDVASMMIMPRSRISAKCWLLSAQRLAQNREVGPDHRLLQWCDHHCSHARIPEAPGHRRLQWWCIIPSSSAPPDLSQMLDHARTAFGR